MNRKLKITLFTIPVILIAFTFIFGSFYTYWNTASPDKTCSSCHEIGKSVYSQAQSSHRDLHCKECHGTALSTGFHSIKEKGMMVVNHLRNKQVENIRLSEKQLLEVMDNCRRCHGAEYANWKSGGHSMDYEHLFLNTKHNTTEQISFDCLRCHGMYFEGTVNDVVEPLNTSGPWKLKSKQMASQSVIPCMACHEIHKEGTPAIRPDYANPRNIFYQKKAISSDIGFYDRHEKTHFAVSDLPKLNLQKDNRVIKVSDDLTMRNCVQCHAPNAKHEAGTQDDRTPRGVHEGLSCMACHEPHSNNARNSCASCHPAISNCKIDVTKMNTSYADATSPNNIHFVACTDCHKEEKKRIVSTFRN